VNPAWVAALVAFAGLILGVLGWLLRGVWRLFRRGDQFLEDWNGIAADPGHERRPGVMERLVRLEHNMADIQEQVHLNSGHSMRDEVQQIKATVETLVRSLADVKRTVDELKARP
jgi:hypothetical protein